MRTTRSVRLTELGAVFYKRVAILMRSVKDAEEELVGMSGRQVGRVRVSAPRGYEESNVVHSLTHFHEALPDIKVQIEFTDRLVDLIAEGYDLVLRVGDLKDSSLVSRKVASHRFRFVCSKNYHQRSLKGMDALGKLNFRDYIEFRMQESPPWRVTHANDSTYRELPAGGIQSNSIKFVKECLTSGQGFSFLPDFLCRKEIENGELISFLNEYSGKEMKVYLIHPNKRFVLPRVRMLIDLLTRQEPS